VVKSIAGQISLSLLDLIRKDECQALFPDAHTSPDQAELSTAPQAQPLFQLQPKAGLPLSKEGSNHGLYSCGWVLNKNDIFIADKLISYLQSLPNIQRIKGVFHTQEGWVLYNQAINETTVSPITYRRDSRVEIITTRAFKKDEIQQKLIDCLHISTQ